MTAKQIERIIKTGSAHCLFSKTGSWYHLLNDFPATLFDTKGYIIFNSKEEFNKCSNIRETKELNIRKGISSIPGYKLYTREQHFAIFGK